MRLKPKTTDLPTLAKAARKHGQKLVRSFAEVRKATAKSSVRFGETTE